MRIQIYAIGTRGDVQPMIALGKAIQAAGHTVTLFAGTNFAEWIRGHGLTVIPTIDIEAMMQSEKGTAWTGTSNPRAQLAMMRGLLEEHAESMFAPIVEHAPEADLIMVGFVADFWGQTISEKFGVPELRVLLQPYRPSRAGSATLVPMLPRRESALNLFMGNIAERLIWGVGGAEVNKLRVRLGLKPHTARTFGAVNRAVPTIHGFSRHVVPVPPDYPPYIHTTGYWFLEEDAHWQPPADLLAFLDAGDPPVYVGFGSMASGDPAALQQLITAAIRKAGVRGIVAGGWSKIGESEANGGDVFTLRQAPHSWLFPRIAGAVHHGGAGTTAASLRAGIPTFVISHISDQPFWGRRVWELGAGPKPIERPKLTVDNLAAGIRELATNAQMKANAAALGHKIRAEDGLTNALTVLNGLIR